MSSQRRLRSSDLRNRTRAYRCKEYLRQFIAFMFSNIGIIGLVVGYTFAGSFMFTAIEKGSYHSRLDAVRRVRNATADTLWLLTCCDVLEENEWKNIVYQHLKQFQGQIVHEVLSQGYEGDKDPSDQWSFSGSFLFSLSVITSIGQCYFYMLFI